MNLEQLSDATKRRLQQAQIAARVVGLVVPIVLTSVSTVLYAVWMTRLPNPAAIHWGPDGMADDFGSPWMGLVLFPVVSLVLTAMYFTHRLQSWQAAARSGSPLWGPIHRLIPAVVLGAVVLLFVMNVGTTLLQLDLADASEMPSANPIMFSGFGAAVLCGVLAYFAQPRLLIEQDPERVSPQHEDAASGEQLVWSGAAAPSRAYWWVVSATLTALFASSVLTLSIRPLSWAPVVLLIAITVLVAVLLLLCSRFRVHIDESGVRATGLFGWPVFRVPASDIDRVEAANILPFAEFGGWGLRWVGGGQVGIVLRSGAGIRIMRTSGKRLIITLDDAENAAAVLRAVASRAARDAPELLAERPSEHDPSRETGHSA